MSTSVMKALLRERFPVREWALAFEVSNATGSQAGRHADAVAMNLWPSRGMAVHGFEFKVSRGDWLRELKQPEKAEAVAQYCDHWWVVATEGVVRLDELPPTWGLIELQCGNGLLLEGQAAPKLVTVKQAPQKASQPIDRPFMAALFRKLSQIDHAEVEQAVAKKMAGLEARREEAIEQEVQRRTHRYEELRKRVAEFQEASGINLEDWTLHPQEFGKAVKFVLDCEIFKVYGAVSSLHSSMVSACEDIGKVIACHERGETYVRENPVARRKRRQTGETVKA
jgi:hypothetical protein